MAGIVVFSMKAIAGLLHVGEVSHGVMHITVTLQDVSRMAAHYLTVVVFVFNRSPVEMAQY